jgi:DNA-binding response OmpR family regulator
MKLLIVDDYVDLVKILSSFLELSDHKVDVARNGIEAVKLLKNNFYEVVITDAEMPGMDGVELCKFIKFNFSDIYVIGVSGCSHSLEELRDAGADICFSKPFHIEQLEKTIENRFSSLQDLDAPSGMNDSGRPSGRLFTTTNL